MDKYTRDRINAIQSQLKFLKHIKLDKRNYFALETIEKLEKELSMLKSKVYTVWFRYGDEKDFYYITLPGDCENPLKEAKKLDSRIYTIE